MSKLNITNYSIPKLLTAFIISLLVGCFNGEKSDLVYSNIIRNPASIGEQLYQTKCASCHGPVETSEKIGRTFTQIKSTIQSGAIEQMNSSSLTALTDEEIQNIVDALNRPIPPGPPQTLKFKQIIGGRTFLRSKFTTLFAGSGASPEEQQILALIDSMKFEPGYLGGKCPHLEFCTALGGITQQADADAQVHPLPSVTRRGFMTKMCQEILSLDAAVTNSLAVAGLSLQSLANEENMGQLYTTMSPSSYINSTVSNGLISLHTEAKTNQSLTDLQAWRMVIYALCISPTFEQI